MAKVDWQAKFTELYGVVDRSRTFPADFDFEANVDQLIADVHDHAKTLGQLEALDQQRKSHEEAEKTARDKVRAGDFDSLTTAEKAALKKST